MVGRPRHAWFTPDEPQLIHAFSRTVRGAFLLGYNHATGRDCSYRRDWIEERVEFLCRGFAVEALGFATLANHYHLLLRHRPDWVSMWDDWEVARRWWSIDAEGGDREPQPVELRSLLAQEGWAAERRSRLSNPSWFMQYLNQPIARRANKEDGTIGHFFQERFGAVLLESEEQAVACSLYIDLNEIRAGIADTLEESFHTSAFRRLARIKQWERRLLAGNLEPENASELDDLDSWLAPINEQTRRPLLEPIFQPEPVESEEPEEFASETTEPAEDESTSPSSSCEPSAEETFEAPQRSREELMEEVAAHAARQYRESRLCRMGFLPMTEEQYFEKLRWMADEAVKERKAENQAGPDGNRSSPPDGLPVEESAPNHPAFATLSHWLEWIQKRVTPYLGSLEDFEREAGLAAGETRAAGRRQVAARRAQERRDSPPDYG